MINQITEIVSAITDAGININWIKWDGIELGITTDNQEKTIEILKVLAANYYPTGILASGG
ncbi:hypothetical protein Back11_14690 [Paenibacillus baekrokdamisoli]|uniref:Uncharacterized protein n=1 Tax=Paenibacillus baekrokdamisoli TaxID=1712516 RepID=A0A3G9JA20_9BACL|nr:hypothetical protein [Paenibacillus baekrokdamisoli]MBB3072733.1 hypothetical protein [Paenibacillus baekrokdamisoli]BBH20124.1 hypothetical protein Back11_14690 [Paenibacillus baekrokdamisoli]